jgi:uncharacterized phage protein gp47/JayE
MAITIPTTQEQKETNLANFESALNQSAPDNEKSFLRVASAVEALQFTALYKYGVDAVLQNLALTATGEDLENLGDEYGVSKKPATFWEGNIAQDIDVGTTIPTTNEYVSDVTGLRYRPINEVEGTGPGQTFQAEATESGTDSFKCCQR